MAKLGVITDGISRDLRHALGVMTEVGLTHAEFQFIGDKEVGDLSPQERKDAKGLVDDHGLSVSCISRHNFAGAAVRDVQVGDAFHTKHMDGLKRCIEMAHEFGSPLVRIMSFNKEMILFASHGADHWQMAQGAWDHLPGLLEPPVRLAEEEGVTLVLETGNNAMVTSGQLGRRLVDEMGSEHLKILWDPGNSLYCTEPAYPDGFEALRGGALGHIHMKDAIVQIAKATVEARELGTGQMAPHLEPLAAGLKADGYDGAISLESIYRPEGGDFEEGFRASVETFKRIFG